jgi:hypothetical protein
MTTLKSVISVLVAPKSLRIGMLGCEKILMGIIRIYHIREVFQELVAIVWG